MPSASEFEEADQGCWDLFREFVESWADDCGVFYQWPEDAIRHFDWDKYERDCRPTSPLSMPLAAGSSSSTTCRGGVSL